MTVTATLPVVRVRVSCANAQEYRRARAPEFAARGVFVPSARMRPVGARVHLRIELNDRTFGHDGEAVVSRHVRSGARSGYLLRLGGGVDERSDAAPRRPAPAAGAPSIEPTPDPAPLAAPTIERTPDPVALAEFLFSDLNLGDAALPAGPLVGDELVEARPRLRVRARETPRPTPVPSRPPAAPPPPSPPAFPSPAPAPARTPVPAPARPTVPAPVPPPLPTGAARGADAPAAEPTPAPLLLAPVQAPATDDGTASDPGPPAAPSRRAERLRRFRRAAPVIAAVLLGAAVSGGGLLLAGPSRAEARAADFAAELRRADERLRSGRLAGAGTDSALDHLVAARELVPDDPRLTRRLRLLGDLFGDLAERALARGDLEEARAHLQARVRADPGDPASRRRLREVTDRLAGAPAGGAPAAASAGARGR